MDIYPTSCHCNDCITELDLLVFCGCIVCGAMYVLWGITSSASCLYADIILSTLAIGLMFQCNEFAYKKLCGPCIYMCFVCFDRSEETQREKDRKRYMAGRLTMTPSRSAIESLRSPAHAEKRVTQTLVTCTTMTQAVMEMSPSAQDPGNVTPVADDVNGNDEEKRKLTD